MSLFPISTTTIFSHDVGNTDPNRCTVIVSSYNYAHYVADTLDTVARQTYRSIELIVVDDNSPDNSVDAIKDWMEGNADRFSRCLLVKHDENQGLAQSRNTAFENAQSEFVFVLDSDNHIYPRCLERHVEVMQRTDAAAVYAISELFGDIKGLGPADIYDPERLRRGNYIDAMALVRCSAWFRVGGYAHFDTMGWEDYDMWLKFTKQKFRIVFIPEVLCRYRTHKASMQHAITSPRGLNLHVEMSSRHSWVDL
jgi:glycosyltransferase involved in cell wall biosynthesis